MIHGLLHLALVTSVLSTIPEQPPCVPLVNAGFEADDLLPGWSRHVYGAQPHVSLDTSAPREGKQSLRVTAGELSDTAFGQELQLTPGRWYRLSGWIRTQDLDPHGAPVFGTCEVQQPGGRGVVATGRNHGGTSPWACETIYFTPPGDGLTRISLFFVGYGKGTGTAWFDDWTIEEIEGRVNRLTIARQRACSGEISPYQYGQFIEYLCGLTLSMYAEKIFDGSFEGVPPYGFEFRKATDRLEQPWYPDGAVHRGEFSLDSVDPFNGKLSQRIAMKSGAPCTLGVSQGLLGLRSGEPLKLSLFLKGKDLTEPVRVALWGEGKTYAEAEFRPTEQWQRFTASLPASDTDSHAAMTISTRGPGTLWIDQVSLMPLQTVAGWRCDVAEAVKALKPAIIRFGGSTTEGFEWTDAIGDPTRRVPFTTYWGGLEPGNAGLEEFVQLCQWVEAEPLICVRFTGKTPKDAADQVEYFNGPAESPMGQLRANNGHSEPYGVKYWQIGNELGDETYQQGVAAFCQAMKQVDPTIKLLAAFPTAGLLRHAGRHFDYICPHHYGCQNLSAMENEVQRLRQMIAEEVPGKNIRLAITEWNTTAGDWGLDRAMLWTLDNALWCARYHNFMHRHCDFIEIANRSNLADSFCSGIIQTNNHALFKTPTYYVQELYANHAGSIPLVIQLDSELPGDPALDCSATIARDGGALTLFAVNHTGNSQQRTLDLSAFELTDKPVEVFTVCDTAGAGERDVANCWREPDRVRTRHETASLTGQQLVHVFPPLSITCLKIACAPGPLTAR